MTNTIAEALCTLGILGNWIVFMYSERLELEHYPFRSSGFNEYTGVTIYSIMLHDEHLQIRQLSHRLLLYLFHHVYQTFCERWPLSGLLFCWGLVDTSSIFALSRHPQCTASKPKKQIAIVWLISLVYAFPQFFELELENINNQTNTTTVSKATRAWAQHYHYQVIYSDIISFLIAFIIPLILQLMLVKSWSREIRV